MSDSSSHPGSTVSFFFGARELHDGGLQRGARFGELLQAVGEQVGGDAGQGGEQLGIAPGAEQQLANDQQCPSPMFKAFGDGAAVKTFVAYFPYVWLPAVMVTFAGHLMSFRRLKSDAEPA